METKEIKTTFTDRATLACSAEEIKEKLDGIELLFYNCNNKLAEMEMSACERYAYHGRFSRLTGDYTAERHANP